MPSPQKTLVLVADDEPSTLALVAGHMRAKGFDVLEAADGDAAWELAHEYLPDLVVLDVMMPGMSGWEVCRKIRETVSLAHTGVVMLTGIGENLNEMTSPLYGADSHVDKPFEFSTLDQKVTETLARRRDERSRGAGDDDQVPSAPASADFLDEREEPEALSARAVTDALAKVLGRDDGPGAARKKPRAAAAGATEGEAAPSAVAPQRAARKAKTGKAKAKAAKTPTAGKAAKKKAPKKPAARKTAKKKAPKKPAARRTAKKKAPSGGIAGKKPTREPATRKTAKRKAKASGPGKTAKKKTPKRPAGRSSAKKKTSRKPAVRRPTKRGAAKASSTASGKRPAKRPRSKK